MAVRQKVVARMTITRKGSNKKTIFEVHADASFGQFYKVYIQEGRKRKRFVRACGRNEGITPYYRAVYVKPGLDVVAERLASFQKDIDSVSIKVFNKKKYNQLLTCAPEQLGALPKNDIKIEFLYDYLNRRRGRGIPVQLPANYIPFSKRMAVITGVES